MCKTCGTGKHAILETRSFKTCETPECGGETKKTSAKEESEKRERERERQKEEHLIYE